MPNKITTEETKVHFADQISNEISNPHPAKHDQDNEGEFNQNNQWPPN
jgi:hypothetical protein